MTGDVRLDRVRLERLADGLHRAGVMEPGWAAVFAAAPRPVFVPEVIWAPHDDAPRWRAVDRRRGADEVAVWDDLVYSDSPVVTQVDDGRPLKAGRATAVPTSSISKPSLVLGMLAVLDVTDGMHVLEVGTGSGWNAALLAARLGADHVTSVEVDEVLLNAARRALARAGFGAVTTVAADGALGWAPGGPYDRIIVTCAVTRLPRAWIDQTRPGGKILVPWAPHYGTEGALADLTVDEAGIASGRFIADASFMWMRAQRRTDTGPGVFAADESTATLTTTTTDPTPLLAEEASVPLGVQVPEVRRLVYRAPEDGPAAGEYTLWLTDDAGSWACVEYVSGATTHEVAQDGPRRLWDELEAAWHWWDGEGRPGPTGFGLTASAEGAHVWYRDPTGPHWPVTTAATIAG